MKKHMFTAINGFLILLVLVLGFSLLTYKPQAAQDTGIGSQVLTEPLPEGDVPVLLYHHISDILSDCTTEEKFKQDMTELKAAGFNAVFFDDLYEYVINGKALPENPIVISFDDGYKSNYEIVYPLLKELGLKADIALIGTLEGAVTGEDWWSQMGEYFTWEDAREMQDSGVIRIQSHTFDMHDYYNKDRGGMVSTVRKEDQNEDEYVEFFKNDITKMKDLIYENLNYENKTLVYPLGEYDEVTETLLDELGYSITATIEPGINHLVKGDPSTLRLLKRISCDNFPNSVVELIKYHINLDKEGLTPQTGEEEPVSEE